MENTLDDRGFQRIQKDYLDDLISQLKEITDHLASEPDDMETVQRFAHRLKGSGKSLGFLPLSDVGRKIEESAKESNRGRLSMLLQSLSPLIGRLKLSLA